MKARRRQLDAMTRRWRARRDARQAAGAGERPAADAERMARARDAFPYRQVTPAAYAERYGPEMIGFTYDEYSYDDPELDAWLIELGRILREQRGRADG